MLPMLSIYVSYFADGAMDGATLESYIKTLIGEQIWQLDLMKIKKLLKL